MRLIAAIWVALWGALSFAAAPVAAQERILGYDSQIQVLENGTLDVTETIRVNVQNIQINHGIYRDFPTRYDGTNGRRIKIGFTLLDTMLDGRPEANKQSRMINGVRVRIGNPDTYVPVGEHEYRIHYRVTRELGRFADHDELYWNVTGTGWDFTIEHASATVTLPVNARFPKASYYTGSEGSREQFARIVTDEPGQIRIETTAPLGPHQGLTIVAAIPKGIIAPDSSASRLGRFITDMLPMLVSLLSLGGLCFYLYRAWVSVGRDPKAGSIVPLFSPPDDLSPASVRYIVKQRLDNRGFAAALVDAAVKGHVRLIQEEKGLFSSEERRIDRVANDTATPLSPPENAAISLLVAPGQSLVMRKENHEIFSGAKSALSNGLKQEYQGKLFNLNLGWAAAAMLTWLAGLWATSAATAFSEDAANPILMVISFGGIGLSILIFGMTPNEKGTKRTLMFGVATVIAAIALLFGFPFIPEALATGRFLPFLPILLGLPVAISAFWWMSAPTVQGQATLDRIQGFKQYLSTTEKDRFDRMQAPQENLQLFEKYLPYAIALDVENRWAKRFAGALAAASTAVASSGSQPFLWYSGSHDPWTDTGGFVNSISGSLATTIASASIAPGSSSGFGGGFSGGGGGGGGGGGW